MMGLKTLLTTAALLAGAAAQKVATYADGSRSIAVNIPDGTASSGSGAIYFQISAPSGTQWLAFGTGSQMSNSNMFVVYASGSTPVLSGRTASGHNMPTYDSSIKLTMLSGSGVQADGSFVVNARCDNCLSWSGGTMSPTSSSTKWIMAYKSGSALGSTDTSASISQHTTHKSFTLDLTAGVGGSSSNPFVAAAQSSSSASASASASGSRSSSSANANTSAASVTSSAAATGTSGISQPVASTQPNTSSSSETSSSSDNTDSLRLSHGVIMSLLFLGFFPFFALTLYLPTANKVRFIHAPLQVLSVILLIVGLALGIVLGQKIDQLDKYHQIIGYILVFVLVLVQPVMGFLQHMHFHKTGGRSMWGPIHQGLGRGMIVLGIVNGGLGWQLAGNTSAYVPYAVVSVIVFVIYVGVVVWATWKAKGRHSVPIDKESKSPNGYEMHNTHRRLDSENVPQTSVQAKQDRY